MSEGIKKEFEPMVKEKTKKSLNFLSWVQEFTKKIVVVIFILYVIANIIFLGIGVMSWLQNGGELMYFTTLISEINSTFRNIIGGYIVKAAVENAIKISGGIIEKILDSRMKPVILPNVEEENSEEYIAEGIEG